MPLRPFLALLMGLLFLQGSLAPSSAGRIAPGSVGADSACCTSGPCCVGQTGCANGGCEADRSDTADDAQGAPIELRLAFACGAPESIVAPQSQDPMNRVPRVAVPRSRARRARHASRRYAIRVARLEPSDPPPRA